MKTCTAIVIMLGIAMATSAQDIDRFRYFHEHGVMDPGFSSQAANSLVREGIVSEDPKVVELTIRGLGNLASAIAHDLPHAYAKLPDRTFQTVPGLKQFLIEHWREEHEKVGFSTAEAIRDSTGIHLSDGVTETFPSPADWGLEVTDAGEAADLNALLDEMDKRLPSWPMIPQILSVYWPGDSEVEQFLYEMRDTDKTPNITLSTLGLLNVGKFTSAAANAYRLSQLGNPDVEEIGAYTAVILAAEGLALSRPLDALPALIAAGVKHPGARSAVLIAVAGYDESQLELHTQLIGRLVQGGIGAMPTAAETEAYDRLIRLSASSAAKGGRGEGS